MKPPPCESEWSKIDLQGPWKTASAAAIEHLAYASCQETRFLVHSMDAACQVNLHLVYVALPSRRGTRRLAHSMYAACHVTYYMLCTTPNVLRCKAGGVEESS